MSHPTCKWCGQPIRWVTTSGGRRMPVDPQPNAGGNVALVDEDDGVKAQRLSPTELADFGGRLWMPHAATCTHVRTRTGTKGEI